MDLKKDHISKIGIGHGKFTYKRSSGSVYVSAVKPGGMITSGFVMPNTMYKENTKTVIYLPAHTSGNKDMGGFATNKTLEVPNGNLLRVVNNRKKNGRDYLNASMIVLVHEKAGMIRVEASLPDDAKNAIGNSIAVYEGKGVVLSDDDIYNLQYGMNGLFVKKYRDTEEVDEAFKVTYMTSGFTISDFSSNKRANGVIDVIAKAQPQRRKITLI